MFYVAAVKCVSLNMILFWVTIFWLGGFPFKKFENPALGSITC